MAVGEPQRVGDVPAEQELRDARDRRWSNRVKIFKRLFGVGQVSQAAT